MEVTAMRYLWLFILLPFLVGCGVGQDFPEDRWIEGPWPITGEWRTIALPEPLVINQEGIQHLYLIVDGRHFKRRHLNIMREMTEKELAQEYLLEHKQEGWLLEPELIAINQKGTDVPLTAGRDYEPRDTSAIVATGYTESGGFYYPHWPESMEAIKAIRVRSDRPFTIQAIRWNMDRHPDIHACWGPCPAWLTALDKTLYKIESWFGLHDESAHEG